MGQLICLSAPMAQKSKKAKPDDHETNDSAIRLIGFLAPMEQKAKKQSQMTMKPTILLFGLFAFSAPMSRGAKRQTHIRLFGFGPCDKAKAKKPFPFGFLAHWWGTNWL